MTATQDTPVNAPTTIDAGPLTLSARIRGPRQQPRGVIVVLHGGTYDSGYYDTGADSLLELAATLGYLVIAMDRPGYGATHGAGQELLTFDSQTTILSQALLQVWTDIALVWLEPLSMIRWMRKCGGIIWCSMARNPVNAAESLRAIRSVTTWPVVTFITAMIMWNLNVRFHPVLA